MPASRSELRFQGPAKPEYLDRTHDLLDRLWRDQTDVAEVDRMMFTTAVLEVANNIISHGGARFCSLVLQGDQLQLEASFCDDGDAVDVDLEAAVVSDDLAESGRGLALVRMAVDELSYRYQDGCSRWHLVRRRSPSGRRGLGSGR